MEMWLSYQENGRQLLGDFDLSDWLDKYDTYKEEDIDEEPTPIDRNKPS